LLLCTEQDLHVFKRNNNLDKEPYDYIWILVSYTTRHNIDKAKFPAVFFMHIIIDKLITDCVRFEVFTAVTM
jgi:hypothetical protein